MDGHTASVHEESTVCGEIWEYDPTWRGLRLRTWCVPRGIFPRLLGTYGRPRPDMYFCVKDAARGGS